MDFDNLFGIFSLGEYGENEVEDGAYYAGAEDDFDGADFVFAEEEDANGENGDFQEF